MLRKLLFFISVLCSIFLHAQVCNNKGQSPYNPLRICSDTLVQLITYNCSGQTIQSSCNQGAESINDANATWYRFTCTTNDSLGFIIVPKNAVDNFNWILFDITAQKIASIYTNPRLTIASNWSTVPGNTGAGTTGDSLHTCFSGNPFSSMPQLIASHEYLLMICCNGTLTNGFNSDYQLYFTQGYKSIVNNTPPHIKVVYEQSNDCYSSKIFIICNKPLQCNTVNNDGSNFSISNFSGSIIQSTNNCNVGNETDTIILYTNTKLTPGNYQLQIQPGNNSTGLADYCGNLMDLSEKFSFEVVLKSNLKMDSVLEVGCKANQITVVFNDDVLKRTIATDGSDFVITGPSTINITSAVYSGTKIILNLATNIKIGGNYKLAVKKGTDGNTILNDCGVAIPEGDSIIISLPDTVSAKFNYHVSYGCKNDTIYLSHGGGNGVDEWYWLFNFQVSANQNPSFTHFDTGFNRVYLFVSNRRCSDSLSTFFSVSAKSFVPSFTIQNGACAGDTVPIINTSFGFISNYFWNFGDGTNSTSANPGIHIFPTAAKEKKYKVVLNASDSNNCFKSYTSSITVLPNCYIAVPAAFTPNNDGLNDYLYPLNAYKANNLHFMVYNRFGQLIFHSEDWTKKWDGKLKGIQQPSGVYVWTLAYDDADTKKHIFKQGTTVLIR